MGAFKILQGTEIVVTEDVFLTAAYVSKGDKTLVGASDPRAALLVARKGQVIPARDAKRLGITKDSILAGAETPAPIAEAKTVAPEDIESRATRPEKISSKRS